MSVKGFGAFMLPKNTFRFEIWLGSFGGRIRKSRHNTSSKFNDSSIPYRIVVRYKTADKTFQKYVTQPANAPSQEECLKVCCGVKKVYIKLLAYFALLSFFLLLSTALE